MKQNELKVGDRVKIKKSSEYYNSRYHTNPADIEGVVIEIRNYATTLPVRVNWDNIGSNAYRFTDLELVKEQPEFKILSYKNKVNNIIWKLAENGRYYSGDIYLNDWQKEFKSINSVMNKDGNTFDVDDEITLLEGINKGNKFTITGFRMKKDGSTVCAITNTHSPYGVGINRIEHFIEKEPEFVLPEKWCINIESRPVKVLEYFNKNNKSTLYTTHLKEHHRYLEFEDYFNGSHLRHHKPWSQEITYEQFKKYVLKEEEPIIISKGLADQVKLAEQDVKSVVIPNETLLEKAKRLYPVGTKFIDPRNKIEITSSGIFVKSKYFKDSILVERFNSHKRSYVFTGETTPSSQWAEIIEEVGPKVGDKFQIYTQPYSTFERRMSEHIYTIEKFEGSLRNPNSVISFTRNYPNPDFRRTETVLLKNVKFVK